MTQQTKTSTFTIAEEDPTTRAYIVQRKSGWFAVSKWIGVDNTQGTTIIGPMSREDAVIVRNGFRHDAELAVKQAEQGVSHAD